MPGQAILSQAEASRRQMPKAQTASLPSPFGGLNARDSYAEMAPTDAIILDNWFPLPNNVAVRNGSIGFSSGFSGAVETVMGYNNPTNQMLFAIDAVGKKISNITGGVAPTTPKSGTLSNARLQFLNFSNAGNTYLYYVNGADTPGYFDGTLWHTSALTNALGVPFDNIAEFGSRLWFTSTQSTIACYLPVGAINGALAQFDFGPLLHLGGGIAGIATWNIDNAAGLQQYFVLYSTKGEVLIYQGYDPTQAATFNLAARFQVGRPIGQRFIQKLGSDLIALTIDGAVPLSKSLLTNRAQASIAVTDKIRNAVLNDIATYKNNFGWQVIFHPAGQKLIINVPVTADMTTYQYVMNTITGAWCTFGRYNSPWNALCFEIFQDNLYYGTSSGTVCQGDTGQSDLGSNIISDVLQAFNYFGAPGVNKNFTLVRPNILTNGNIKFAVDVNTDFQPVIPVGTASYSQPGTPWGQPWGAPWSPVAALEENWLGTTGIGFCGALRMISSIQVVTLTWQSTDYVYQVGGVL